MNREVVIFSDKVLANTTFEDKFRLPYNCTIEKIIIRLYMGNELALEVDPFLLKHNEVRQNLLNFRGKSYFSGDEEREEFTIGIPALTDEEIVVKVKNTSLDFDYDFIVSFELEFEGGTNRNG